MLIRNKFKNSDKKTLIIFILTFTIFSIHFLYQISVYEGFLAKDPSIPFTHLISGDEPAYLGITSGLIYYQSFYLEEHYLNQISGEMLDPFMNWPDRYKDPGTWTGPIQLEDGHYVPSLSVGLPYLLIPGYLTLGIHGAMLTMVFFSSLTAVIVYKFTSKLTTPQIGFITTLIFSFATILLSHSDKIYSDFTVMSFAMISLYFIFEKRYDTKYMAITGALLGYGIFLKISFLMVDVVLIPLVFLLAIKQKISWKNFCRNRIF